MGTFFQDVRYAIRTMVRMRGFAVVVILSLGVGIAATTTMFGVAYAALVRPLPFERPDQLAMLNVVRTTPREGTQHVRWSFPETRQLRETVSSFSVVATYSTASVNLTDGSVAEQVDVEIVSHDYFDVLRVSAARGRVFAAADERSDAPAVALISAGLWQRRYGVDQSIPGRAIAINQIPLTIVGVLPERFAGLSGRADVWILPAMAPSLTYSGYLTTPQHFINVIGRLRSDRTLASAAAELASIAPTVVAPEASAGPSAIWSATAVSLSSARVDPRVSRQVIALVGAIACVLLITCVDIAGLLLARGGGRRREIAVRMAMGSGRWRVVRQLLTETTVLAVLGGLLGGLLTLWATDFVTATGLFAPARGGQQVGAFATPAVDGIVLAFAAGVSLLTAIACGLVPALETSRTDLVQSLKEDVRSGVGRRQGRLLGAFVVGELALAVMLLVIAGLLVRSFAAMQALRSGLSTDGVIAFWVTPAAGQYAAADGPRIVDRLLDQVKRVPGVAAASVNRCVPFDTRCARTIVFFPERPASVETAPIVGRHYISSDYFRALGIPLIAGRTIADDDVAGRPAVAVINQAAARRFWPADNPIGRRVWFGGGSGFSDPSSGVEIVGVVGDVKYGLVDDPPTADFYTSFRQFTYPDTMMIVKTAQPLLAIVPALRTAIATVDRTLPIYDVRSLDERTAAALSRPRVTASVLAAFAGSALLLAAFGVYGVMAHSVALRRREIGIRMALGADRGRVMRRVLAEGGRYAIAGALLGVVAALGVGRLASAMLFGVTPDDPMILTAVVMVMIAVAFASTAIPARRASAVDPAAVLRSE